MSIGALEVLMEHLKEPPAPFRMHEKLAFGGFHNYEVDVFDKSTGVKKRMHDHDIFDAARRTER